MAVAVEARSRLKRPYLSQLESIHVTERDMMRGWYGVRGGVLWGVARWADERLRKQSHSPRTRPKERRPMVKAKRKITGKSRSQPPHPPHLSFSSHTSSCTFNPFTIHIQRNAPVPVWTIGPACRLGILAPPCLSTLSGNSHRQFHPPIENIRQGDRSTTCSRQHHSIYALM